MATDEPTDTNVRPTEEPIILEQTHGYETENIHTDSRLNPYNLIRAVEFYSNGHTLSNNQIDNYLIDLPLIKSAYPRYLVLEYVAVLEAAMGKTNNANALLTRAYEELPEGFELISNYAKDWLAQTTIQKKHLGPVAPKGWLYLDYPLNDSINNASGFWNEFRLKIFERDGYVCTKCGNADDLSVVHITPISEGGTNSPINLMTACKECTSKELSNQHINSISAGNNNHQYSRQNYSLTRNAPKDWEHKKINLNSKSIDPNSFWGLLRKNVWSRDDYICQQDNCSEENWLTVHHIVPLRIGGTNELSNLKTLCWKHHEKIHGRKIYNTGRDFGDINNYGKDYVVKPKIATIRKALDLHEDILIDYNDIKHIHTNRLITPLRLYFKNNKEYLEAYCYLRNAKRTFRVVRIQININ